MSEVVGGHAIDKMKVELSVAAIVMAFDGLNCAYVG